MCETARFMRFWRSFSRFPAVCCAVFCIVALPGGGLALTPEEILVVANEKSGEGVELARYYARLRGIPKSNVVLLNVPVGETCSRDVYERQIAGPLRRILATFEPSWRIRCFVLIYGLPLRVKPPPQRADAEVEALRSQKQALEERIEKGSESKSDFSVSAVADELEDVRNRLNQLKISSDALASVDSELSVVKGADAPIGGWIENPYYIGFSKRQLPVSKSKVLMVSRLDGPDAASVRRIIDDSIAVEKKGLTGVAYFDARWPMDDSATRSAYRRYDRAIQRAARRVEESGRLPVVLDTAGTLFQPGQCQRAALYCGWYSLAHYVDAFDWQKGAVGFHVASSECKTLKKEDSQVWCKRMIEDGVCATVGPVGEPYLQSFPEPEVFFGFLTEGVLSLAECYAVSLPYLSWKMVLIGDPLYRPFRSSRQ
ncbi:TIGR03790 family protein [uncultured Desulfosarcina sp.]|uniref:TIGR03790 family protein n=1 Tax=uncultured Desulfosarcina sp. TaxID=218289 RepID=UPI0029C83286|nr:TIGR03790 family protein [uncultured Desulfosarcina sp.]